MFLTKNHKIRPKPKKMFWSIFYNWFWSKAFLVLVKTILGFGQKKMVLVESIIGFGRKIFWFLSSFFFGFWSILFFWFVFFFCFRSLLPFFSATPSDVRFSSLVYKLRRSRKISVSFFPKSKKNKI